MPPEEDHRSAPHSGALYSNIEDQPAADLKDGARKALHPRKATRAAGNDRTSQQRSTDKSRRDYRDAQAARRMAKAAVKSTKPKRNTNPFGYTATDRKTSTYVRHQIGPDELCTKRDRNRGNHCGRLLCMSCGSLRYRSAIDRSDRLFVNRRGSAFVTVGLAYVDGPDRGQLSQLRGAFMQRLAGTVSGLDSFKAVGAFELVPVDLDQHAGHSRTAIELGHSGQGAAWLFHAHLVCKAGRWGRSYPASMLRGLFRQAFPGHRVSDVKPVPVDHFARMAGYAFKGLKRWMDVAGPGQLQLLHLLDMQVSPDGDGWSFEISMP